MIFLTILLVLGGITVSWILLDEVFVNEKEPSFLLLKFLQSIKIPLGLSVFIISILNLASLFFRSSEPGKDYPFLTSVIVFINSFIIIREKFFLWFKIKNSNLVDFFSSLYQKRKIFGLIGLSICLLKMILLLEPILRFFL